MKPTSNQNARVGKTRKPSHSTRINNNGILNKLDSSKQLITDIRIK